MRIGASTGSFRVRISQFYQLPLAAFMAMALAGCAANDVPTAKSTTGRNPVVAEVPDADETVRGANDPAVITLDLDKALHEQRLASTEKLPANVKIPHTNLNAVPVTAALQAVLSGTDVSLAWDSGALGKRLVSITNLSGPLPQVVEKICAAAKVFCDYRHGSLQLSEKETFVVSLPPVARPTTGGASGGASAVTNSMVTAINGLLGEDKAQVDDQGGNIIYTTTVDGADLVSRYLHELRTGRPLIVMQMYIWEVTLNRENAQGINWSQFSNSTIRSLGLSSSQNLTNLAAATGSVSLGAVTSGVISSSSVASFLATKGRVQTISNPQITFVSGTSAQLDIGGKQRYIKQVGTNLSNVSGNSSSASTNSVDTDDIETGLVINVSGNYESNLVFANLDIKLTTLIALNPTTTSGYIIDLPQTTVEKMTTVLRVRPGDSLVLAGLVSSSDNANGQGLPLGEDATLPFYGDKQANNRELVMIVKPSIVLFSEQKSVDEKKKGEKPEDEKLPEPVVIDKDGSRSLSSALKPLPQVPTESITSSMVLPPVSPVSVPDLKTATLTMTQDKPTPLPRPLPADTTADSKVAVDRNLMQRGFSQAFSKLSKANGGDASTGEEP